ncbi:hypothetical protein Misp02_54950 [Microtetraspora sp. NBRC 16547]|nr:hypothetical protein Misp02_54950 [Microtetraspora sp. NBRC 16547]
MTTAMSAMEASPSQPINAGVPRSIVPSNQYRRRARSLNRTVTLPPSARRPLRPNRPKSCGSDQKEHSKVARSSLLLGGQAAGKRGSRPSRVRRGSLAPGAGSPMLGPMTTTVGRRRVRKAGRR